MELMKANRQWSSRPADERFTSLTKMLEHFGEVRLNSRQKVLSNRAIKFEPKPDHKGLVVIGPNGGEVNMTHWAFGQVASLASAPAGYLRELPAELAADCLTYGLHINRNPEEIGILLSRDDNGNFLRAATGPRYGRVWNYDVTQALVSRFGDGVTGQWKVPGEFGQAVQVSKANTTLFASDRDMFIFLADEENRIEIPNRRNGLPGSLSRGFFVWNSEVGAQTLGIATFLFDYVCCNRIVWGATEYKEIRIRHTATAGDRWIEEVIPAIKSYSEGSARNIQAAITSAQTHKIDKVEEFLANRFSAKLAKELQAVSLAEEGHPIETLWDATAAVTAYARTIPNQDRRVELERKGGEILELAA